MPLRGELNSGDLAHIFQMLLLHEKAGTLEIAHDGVLHTLHFADAGILVPFDRAHVVERALGALCRAKKVQATQVDKARFNARALNKDLLETLEHMGLITAAERIATMRAQLEETVFELFFLRDATFEFREGEVPSDVGELDPTLALSPNGLIMEAARRTDEWQYIQELVHSGFDIFEPVVGVDVIESTEADVELRAVFDALDGERCVEQIIETTGIARFQVFRRVAHLLERQFAREVPVDVLKQRGLRAIDDGRYGAAARLLERAIALGAVDRETSCGAGVACEALREPLRAAHHFMAAGRQAESSGDLESALRDYLRVRALVPTLIEARERLFALRNAATASPAAAGYDAFREGRELAELLFELRRNEELALVLSGLADLTHDDTAKMEAVAELAARLGAFALAIDTLVRVADAFSRARDFAAVSRCLKRAQTLDPKRSDLAERLGLMERTLVVRRGRVRSTMRAIAMVAGFAVLFVAYGKYSSAAMRAYSDWSLEDFVATREFGRGREFYGSICRHYPLTVPFLLALENLREIEVAERNFHEVERYRGQLEHERATTRLSQARSCVDSALNARHGGDIETARRLLKRALELAGDGDPLGIAAGVAELDAYVEQATRLRNEATFFRNAGRFEDAHARLLEAIENYPNAPGMRDVTLPVLIDSEPTRARIRVDGVDPSLSSGNASLVAETPFVLDLPYTNPVTVELASPGFVPLHIELDAKSSARVTRRLPRLPDREAVLPLTASFAAAADAALVVVPQEQGRLCALSPSTLETRFSVDLPDLAGATASPTVTAQGVWVPVTGSKLLRLDRTDGHVTQTLVLPTRGVSAPAVAGNAIALALDDGGIAVCQGTNVRYVGVDSGVAFGPYPSGDRFALVSNAGRVWVLSQGGGLTALPDATFGTGAVRAFAVEGSTLFVGTSDGALFAFDATRLEKTATIPVFPGRPVMAIAADARFPVVESQGRLASVDLQQKTARVVELDARVAGGNAARVAAASSDGLIHVLDRKTLQPLGLFSADAPIDMRGACAGSFAVFSAAKGKVVGVLLDR
jgi:tetratricopeptide (TPR) repeat protein/outer membrane protein assembly factor BamB